jgi:hypothetical protein
LRQAYDYWQDQPGNYHQYGKENAANKHKRSLSARNTLSHHPVQTVHSSEEVDTKKVRNDTTAHYHLLANTRIHSPVPHTTKASIAGKKGVVKDVNLDRAAQVKGWTFALECRQIPDNERQSTEAHERENVRNSYCQPSLTRIPRPSHARS